VVRGNVVATEHLSSTDKGIFRHRLNGIEVSPPLCLLQHPFKKGETWETALKLGAQTAKVTCRADSEEVTVPAGKYKALSVHMEVKEGDMKTRTTYWFAEGIGVVKQTVDVGGKTITIELEKYEAGK
jgi:hypothetical protein